MSPSVAFFDVDYTLVNGNTGFYSSLRLVRHGILKKRRILQALYYLATGFSIYHDVRKIYGLALADMAGIPLSDILKVGQESFEKDVKRRIYGRGIERVRDHQQRGHKVVLLTSGPYMTINWLRAHLNADEAYMMGPEIVDGCLTDRLQMPICHAEGKLHFAQEYCGQVGANLEDAFFYTDHESDMPLLEKVGHPVITNPRAKMKKIALLKGWPIVYF